MKIQSLIGKFGKKAKVGSDLIVIVQPAALYFSPNQKFNLPEQVALNGLDWLPGLKRALDAADISDITIDVVLSSNFYQTYQIDKPNLPQEELSKALPFLLKDLIAEKVTDIVADSLPMPTGHKLQVYVVAKKLILDLVNSLESSKIQLGHVGVEDDLWGKTAVGSQQFFLLQKSKQCHFKVSAFVEQRCIFQRTIRGVSSPVTGVALSGLQLDGLALELQRSVDYLSSQLRGASLHQMKVCCDEEDNNELVSELGQRLSVKVSTLTDVAQESGVVLTQHANALTPDFINLYPAHLKPKREHFTLASVLMFSSSLLIFGVLSYSFLQYQKTQLSQELDVYKSEEIELKQQLNELNQRLATHRPSMEKVAAVKRLKLEIESKKESLDAVGHYDQARQIGYSGVMGGLAKLGSKEISLNYIMMDEHTLNLRGLAKNAESVPSWVNQFKNELNLVGRAFDKLKIGRNEQDIITFELQTKEDTQ